MREPPIQDVKSKWTVHQAPYIVFVSHDAATFVTDSSLDHIYAVILAGGEGTRFWPLSRKARPKQFLALAGAKTMLQATLERISPLVPTQRTLVVTSATYTDLVREQLPSLPPENLLAEPSGRNTAVAVAWAALVLGQRDAEAVMVVLASDHHILNPDTFRAAVKRAIVAAREHRALVLYGLTPDGPKTQYGYILPKSQSIDGDAPRLFFVERFHEKPDKETAKRYLDSAPCFWNSGMFTWRADVVVEELERHAPDVLSAVRCALAVRAEEAAFAAAYDRIPGISVDQALLERSERRLVVESGIERVDLGTWATVLDVWPHDQMRNVSLGDTVAIEATNTVTYTSGRLVATIGLGEVIVVATDDVILVCDRNRAAEVNELVKRLGERGETKWL